MKKIASSASRSRHTFARSIPFALQNFNQPFTTSRTFFEELALRFKDYNINQHTAASGSALIIT